MPSKLLCFALLVMTYGCGGTPPVKPASSQPTTNQSSTPTFRMVSLTAHPLAPADPRDPQPVLEAMVHLDIYTLDLPMGSVSKSKTFWMRVDEQAVGAEAADRLFRSGIRCGTAPKSEGLFFSQFFDKRSNRSRQTTVDTIREGTIELNLKKNVDGQDLFFINSRGQLQGRSYGQCSDNFSLSFGPTPRVMGSVRLTLCPVVTSERQRLQFTSLNDEYETPMQDVDRLYDISVNVDVTDDSFFIVAPSPDADTSDTVGGRFLIEKGKSQQFEQVLVIVPVFLRFDGKPILIRSPVVRVLPGK